MKPTREEILTQVNHIMIAAQRLTSNIREEIERPFYGYDDEDRALIMDLIPCNTETGNGRHIVTLATAILDNGQDTFINIFNFYYLANLDPALPLQMRATWGYGEIYNPSTPDLIKLFRIT